MTLTEFNNLPVEARGEIVWEWGFYLGKQKQSGNTVVIFSIHDFYAEVTMNTSRNNVLEVKGMTPKDLKINNPWILIENNPFVNNFKKHLQSQSSAAE